MLVCIESTAAAASAVARLQYTAARLKKTAQKKEKESTPGIDQPTNDAHGVLAISNMYFPTKYL